MPLSRLSPHQANYQKILKQAEAEKLEALFRIQIAAYNLPPMTANHLFDLPDSRMELDFAHLSSKVGVEIQGGIFGKKRMGHSTGKGIARDINKINAAQLKGWLLILISPQMAIDGSGALLVKRAIGIRMGEDNATFNRSKDFITGDK